MNWTIVFLTFLIVAIEGFYAWMEGTLTPKSWSKPTISFFSHGGMWADGLICPLINGLVWNHLVGLSFWLVFGVTLACGAATFAFHAMWGADKKTTGHMWPAHPTGSWIRDMGRAGWIHFLYMIPQFAILMLYIVNPMPASVVVMVTVLMHGFIFLAQVQPGWYLLGTPFHRDTIVAAVTAVAVWGVALFKLGVF